jgi:hypothetical protein
LTDFPGEKRIPGGSFLNPDHAPDVTLPPEYPVPEDSSSLSGKWHVKEGKLLTPRQEQACYMLAIGSTQLEIASALSLTPVHVSTLRNDPVIIKRVAEIRDKYFGTNVAQRFNNMITPAADFAEQLVKGDVQGVKVSERWAAAQWVLEKTTGKPTQNLNVEAGASVLTLLQEIEKMKQQGQELATSLPSDASREVLELTPEQKADAEMDRWVLENVPAASGAKGE